MLLHKEAFAQRNLYLLTPLNTDTFKHRNYYTQKPLHWTTFTYKRFCTRKLLRTEAFTRRNFYTQKLENTDTFTQRGFCTEQLSHTEAFTHGCLYTQHLLHRGTFTHRNFHTQTSLRTDFFAQVYPETFAERGRYAEQFLQMLLQMLWHTHTQRSLYTHKKLKQAPLHRENLADFTGSDTRHNPGGLHAHSTMHVGTSDTRSPDRVEQKQIQVAFNRRLDLWRAWFMHKVVRVQQNVHVTTRLDLRHARSLQKVAWAQVQIEIILHHTRRISAEGPVSMDVAEQPQPPNA